MSLLIDRDKQNIECKICLVDYELDKMITLEDCSCKFCDECLRQYTTYEIQNGSYSISCPDPECPKKGTVSLALLSSLLPPSVLDTHRRHRLETEVSVDTMRAWCPAPDCHTVCHVCPSSIAPVTCPECVTQFCSSCRSAWHPGLSCEEAGERLVSSEYIKHCPVCRVPIERDAGCAQMMCRRCKHLFCWHCMASLDGDFLLRHYDSGECRGRLGHSRVSVLLHRCQVVGIFAVFGLLILLASPLILSLAPLILCCKCGCCCISIKKK